MQDQTTTTRHLSELASVIGTSKDENGSKHAIKALRELLEREGGDRPYSPQLLPALFKLWDTNVAKNASPNYVEQYSAVFRSLRASRELLRPPQRVRVLQDALGGDDASPSPSFSPSHCPSPSDQYDAVNLVLTGLDFSLPALVGGSSTSSVGLPPKVQGGKLMNATVGGGDGQYARGLWTTRDLARAPTRVGYVGLFVRLMEACCVNLDALEETMACKVLWMRGFVGVSLGYVSKDPWEVQERVLGVVQRASCRAAVVALLGEQGRFLGQLGVVVEQACAWLHAAEGDADGGGVADGLEREGTTAGTVRRVLALASELLTRVVAVD